MHYSIDTDIDLLPEDTTDLAMDKNVKIPDNIYELNLRSLFIHVDNEIPEFVRNLKSLTRLIISIDNVGYIPDWIVELENLTSLKLMTGIFISNYGTVFQHQKLESLSINSYIRTQTTIPDIINCPNLNELLLYSMSIKYTPQTFFDLPLKRFDYEATEFLQPKDVLRFKNLKHIELYKDDLGEWITEFKNLQTIFLCKYTDDFLPSYLMNMNIKISVYTPALGLFEWCNDTQKFKNL